MGILKNQMKVVGLAAFLLSATFTSAVRINAYESSTSINEHDISEPITYAEITKPIVKESKKEMKPKKDDHMKDKEDEKEENQKGNVKHENNAHDTVASVTEAFIGANSVNA